MKRIYYGDDSHKALLSLLMIVIGLVLALWPGHVMTTAMTVLGIALLAGGGILILSWYKKKAQGVSVLRLGEGIAMALGGLFVLARPKFLITIIPFAVGALVLVNGIINLTQALEQRRKLYNRWTVSLTMAILTIVLGLLVLLNPFSTMEVLVVTIGVVFIYNGASNLFIDAGDRNFYR